ncbi:ras-GEF domain-containing family member 1B-B, partial [Musca vetustissima]|uniref:ras-GEF domain-containing family member 1B-B n=1 Tax=Musca vetustissima TaxID=27455 RepID=UPI002AB697A2
MSMSNNGINSATNGRTNSANNTTIHATSGTTNVIANKPATNHHHPQQQQQQMAGSSSNSNSGGGGCGGSTAQIKTSINLKTNDLRTKIATTNVTLPDGGGKSHHMSLKANNNDHQYQQQQQFVNTKKSAMNSSNSSSANPPPPPSTHVNRLPSHTHRRDSSNVSGHNTHTGIVPQSLKDASKYRYIRPQTVYRAEEEEHDEVDRVVVSRDESSGRNRDLLVYYDGQLEGGSLEALIEHMVPTHDYYPDRIYTFSFLLSARLFIRPHELLAKISQTWEKQQQQQQPQQPQQSGTVVLPGSAPDQIDADAGHFNQVTAAGSTNSPLTQRKPGTSGGGGGGGGATTNTQKSAQNCIRLLAEWIETFPYDFRDERLMQQVRILTRKCVYIDNSLGKQVSKILQLLVQRLTTLEKYEEFLQSLQQYDLNTTLQPHYHHHPDSSYHKNNYAQYNNSTLPQASGLPSAAAAAQHSSSSSTSTSSNATGTGSDSPNAHDVFGIMDLCPSCAQLAHQLTAIELDRLSHIGPEEFVQAFAKEYQNSISNKESTNNAGSTGGHIMNTSLNDMKKTRNLESYVEWFNRLSYLTASEIVKYPKKKQRVRVIEYWIETARECFNIGNFNSLMAIIAGLNLAPISRLKKTWSKVQSAKFSVLEHQMDPTSNFNSYRSTLKAAMWRSEGATEERERIIIPFFSLFVKDLYFLNEGCSNRLPNNHINFEKCSQLAKQVMEFNEWKQVSCPFERLPNVIDYLQNVPVLNENTLSMASFECEPPENTEEKDRYKTVKAENKQQLLQQLQEEQMRQQQQQQ